MSFDYSETLEKKVAELFIIRASGHLYDSQREYPEYEVTNSQLKTFLKKGVGGVILFGGSVTELHTRCENINSWSEKKLLLCADVEEGVGQRFDGGSFFIPPLGVSQIFQSDPEKAISIARKYGNYIADQAHYCGLNWVLAPVCDINTNKLNPVINMRAWGEDPEMVSLLACSFQKGLFEKGILTCLKHFPGHGDTIIDSHLGLPVIDHDWKRLEEKELIPFVRAIADGADSVMTSHILLRKIDSEYPCTLSRQLITSLLRKKLGFDGIVVTDALIMKSITQKYGPREAAVLAFEAGVDLIMMPADCKEAIEAIVEAISLGRIPISRLHQSLKRRNNVLKKINSFFPSGSPIKDDFESKEVRIFSETIISNTIKKLNFKPIERVENGNNLLRNDFNKHISIIKSLSPAIFSPEPFGFKSVIVNEYSVNPWRENNLEPLSIERFYSGPFILQLFLRGNPFGGSAYMQEPWLQVIKQLQSINRLSALVVYGSPYIWSTLTDGLDPSVPALYSPGQTKSAQKMIMELLFSSRTSSLETSPIDIQFTD